MSSLHGPVLMWHEKLDITTIRRFKLAKFTHPAPEPQKKKKSASSRAVSGLDYFNFRYIVGIVSVLVTSWSNKAKTRTERGCCLAALTGGWNRDSDDLDGCNIQKGCHLISASSSSLVSLQRGRLCRDHDPGIHMLNERNWRKIKHKYLVFPHSSKSSKSD